jgi:PhnB protein
MAFYQACLGGELTITRVGNTPMKDQAPPSQHAKVADTHLASGPRRQR